MGLTILKVRESFPTGPVQTVNDRAGEVVLTKADVGLSAVNNTADSAKPVSTAQQAALDTKRDIPVHHAMGSGTVLTAGAINTKSVSGDVTLTHGGTNDGTLTRALITASVGINLSFPSCIRVGGSTVGPITGIAIPAGTSELSFEFINGTCYLADSVGSTTETPDTGGGTVATPTFSPVAASYNASQDVTIATTTGGADIYYTTDGSTPTTSSTLYTGPVTISSSLTLKAFAVKTGMSDSSVRSGAYVIDTVAPTNTSSTINGSGNQLTVNLSEACSFGAGGNGGFALSATGGAVTATYSSGAGTNALVYSLSRTVLSSETVTLDYTNPGNGIEDVVGNDLASFSGHSVTGGSTGGGGGSWTDTGTPGSADGEVGPSYNGQMFGGTIVAPSTAPCTKLRIYCSNATSAGSGVIAIMTTGGTVLASANYPGASVGWLEADISGTSPTLTSGVRYVVMYTADAPTGAIVAFKWDAGNGRENGDQVASSFPSGTVTLSTTDKNLICGIFQ